MVNLALIAALAFAFFMWTSGRFRTKRAPARHHVRRGPMSPKGMPK
jgi:hypothetical protein